MSCYTLPNGREGARIVAAAFIVGQFPFLRRIAQFGALFQNLPRGLGDGRTGEMELLIHGFISCYLIMTGSVR